MTPVIVGDATLYLGDCIEVMRAMPDNSVHAIVTDPPYGLEFMGKEWDGADGFRRSLNKADVGRGDVFGRTSRTSPEYRAGHLFQEWCEAWSREALRVLKPGGHMLAFSGSRTYHRMACAIEDAGFEIRDQIMWVYGSGFPKSRSIVKDLEKVALEEMPDWIEDWDDRDKWLDQWRGWGTALKPANEPICMARKPLAKGMTVAANVQAHGTGAINIDGCRVDFQGDADKASAKPGGKATARAGNVAGKAQGGDTEHAEFESVQGARRWPANLIHDGSAEVVAMFPANAGAAAPVRGTEPSAASAGRVTGARGRVEGEFHGDSGSAARFFYCPKASRTDRNEGCDGMEKKPLLWPSGTQNPGSFQAEGTDKSSQNNHPTVKPTDLMAYLVRLVTPPGGVVYDPFMGSGSTGKACVRERMRFIGSDITADYVEIACARIGYEQVRVRAAMEKAAATATAPQLDLFGAEPAPADQPGLFEAA